MSYDQDKNLFFAADEDDDFSMDKLSAPSSGYGGSYGRDGDPFRDSGAGGGSSRYEELQQMKENSMNRQYESTQRALASIYDSEAMGVATAEELVQQGEQLDNVETKLDKINQDMKTSQKHLNSIKSIFGGIKTWWGGKKPEETTPQETQSKTAYGLQTALDQSRDNVPKGPHPAFRVQSEDGRGMYEDDLDDKFLGGGARSYNKPSPGGGQRGEDVASARQRPQQSQTMKSGLQAHDEKLDENLDMMSEGMLRLKGLALGLGTEIERQNDQIEVITGKADRSDIKLTDQNRQMRHILKK